MSTEVTKAEWVEPSDYDGWVLSVTDSYKGAQNAIEGLQNARRRSLQLVHTTGEKLLKAKASAALKGRWLSFLRDCGIAQATASRYEQLAKRPLQVILDGGFKHVNEVLLLTDETGQAKPAVPTKEVDTQAGAPAHSTIPTKDELLTELRAENSLLRDENIRLASAEQERNEKEAVRRNEQAKREQERLALRDNPLPLPEGQYRTVVVDPPWPVHHTIRKEHEHTDVIDYPLQEVDEIKAMDVPGRLAEDAWLFLWTTQRFLPAAFEVLEAWGCRYRFCMVWFKPGGFQVLGLLPAFNTEFVLCASKGKPAFAEVKAFNTGFKADRGEHSEKPAEFYELLARVTGAPRLAMYERQERPGFEVWGNEVNGEVPYPPAEQVDSERIF